MNREESLQSRKFRRERMESWKRLEELLNRCESAGLRSLSGAELAELPVLYRGALSSLSVARSISLDRALIEYLENLSARAYFAVYRPKRRMLTALRQFFADDFPEAVQALRRPIALALLIFVTGSLVGFWMTVREPAEFHALVDENMASGRGPQSTSEELLAVLYSRDEDRTARLSLFAAHLFSNNAGVGLLAFALGGLAGVPVFILLFNNALGLGAFGAIHWEKGISADFWGWILPHGVTEILAIILCGGAGLAVARGMLFPGRFNRLDALRLEGHRAVAVVLGCVAMFAFAGLVEGCFRQLVTDISLRYALAVATALFWLWYFFKPLRRRNS